MEAFVVNTSRLVSDVIGGIAELKNTFHTEGQPINDDNVTLQKFCVKLETILRHQQKEKYTLLGIRKDYWNFITDVVSKDDGVKYVNMIPQMKTSQGKGRCFIRYALVKQTLADTIQRLLVSKSTLSSWYREDAILRNPSLSTALINKLYDLNGVEFDLPCAGYDLDISWPAFSRRTAKDGNSSGRRDSISSMKSVDFRNERRDPVIDLASEVASLMEFFETEATGPREGKAKYDSISLTSASESPTINEITLQVSGVHKRALQWKADFVNERASTAHSLRKAQDDRQFAIQESELKTKQLMEKFSNLAKVASEESEKKIAVLTEALSKAESSLQERDSELRALRDEVNKSVVSTSTAHKSAIELEKQLMASERKRTELESEIENLNYKIQSNEQSEGEFNDKEKRLKERVTLLEEKEMEYKELISELRGNLKAKEVALENIQASFEKLTGMVFGSFEELESNMKEKLVDKEKGLQNQTIENRKLELQVTDLRHQLEETKTALSEHKSKLNSTETSYKDIQSSNLELQQLLEDSNERLSLYASLLQELHHEAEGENNVNDVMSLNSKKEIQDYFQSLLSHIKDSKLKISQAQDLITANDKELANRQEDIQRLTDLIEQHKQQFNKLQNEAHENENVITSITTKLEEANNEIIRLINDNDDCKTTIDSIREEIKFLTEEKTSIEAQANIDKQQLEMANEGRIRAECAQIKAEEELKNVKCVMEQEVAALRFQLSSETMKFEEEIKVFSEQNRENVVNKERCLTLEETIADLESKLKERNNEWESEKRKFVNEIKRLRSQVQLLNNALEGNKQKKMSLENDLLLTTKQLDEERARQKDIKQHVQDVEARKLESEKLLQGKIDEMGDDMKDLKNKIVSLTREKAELWQKAAEFEHELKLKATDRWVEDNEVNKCSSCKTEFSFLVRKHHCRLCGRIFCHSCANNWVRTAHSSKLKRVCNGCISKDQRLKPQEAPQRRNTEDEDFDDTMSDISFGASPRKNMSSSSIDVSDDEQTPSTSKTPTLKRDDLPSNAKSNKSARDAIIHDGGHESNDSFGNYEEFNKEKSDGSTSVDSTKVDSPQDVDYEFIDQNEEVGELPESRVVISNTDVKGELVIPAVNDEEGISRDFSVSPGTRYIVPVMVATPGAILCWSFKTVYKSVIFGLAYKQTESVSDDDIETLYPLARYSSNETPVEGEWKTSSHGVYVLVFDNSFSRFTSKQVSYVVHVKRRSSILKPS